MCVIRCQDCDQKILSGADGLGVGIRVLCSDCYNRKAVDISEEEECDFEA